MMTHHIRLSLATLTLVALSACGTTGRKGPDEFAVQRAAPLVVPPDYALAPPQAGAPRPQDAATQRETLEAMFGGPAPRSQSEQSMLQGAGVNRAERGIRSVVGDPATFTVDKGSAVRDILAAPEGNGADAAADTPARP